MKNTTIALIQSLIALLAILTNASLQSLALAELNKSPLMNADVDDAKKLLLITVILQFVAAILMITATILLIIYRNKFQQHMNKFVYIALVLSGFLLLVGGSLGAAVAVRLQCYRGDPHVESAWQKASISSAIGIVGTILLLIVQAFTRKETIKSAAREYLTHKYIRVPTHRPIPVPKAATYKKAPMPAYHPPLCKMSS